MHQIGEATSLPLFSSLLTGLDAGNAPRAHGGTVANTGWKDEPIAGVEKKIALKVREVEADTSLDTEKGFAVGVGMDFVDSIGPVGPPGGAQFPRTEETQNLFFQNRTGMGPS